MSTRIGIIGCGNISGIYFSNLAKYDSTEVVACADLDKAKATAAAEKYGVAACEPEELLGRDDIDVVLNLTVPQAHYEVAKSALESGKDVYNEKPLTLTRSEALELLDLAEQNGRLVGCAPDTFLGAAFQTCRQVIDCGQVGEIVGGNCFMLCHGHESWHPSPEFYYQTGGGPLFDMGPYYLTALVSLIGPVAAVTAVTRATFPTRTITSEPKRGQVVDVETPTHIAALLEFANGAVVQLTTSFDVWHSKLPNIELYGTEGSLIVPDPNGFGGPIWMRGAADRDWIEVPHAFPYAENSRGLGVMDLGLARAEARSPRASGHLAYHVLDVMHATLESGEQARRIEVESRAERPSVLPNDN